MSLPLQFANTNPDFFSIFQHENFVADCAMNFDSLNGRSEEESSQTVCVQRGLPDDTSPTVRKH